MRKDWCRKLMTWKAFHSRLLTESKLTSSEMVYLEEKGDSNPHTRSSRGWLNK